MSSLFLYFYFFILWQGEWRSLSSSGLPRPSFACDLTIGPRRPHSTPSVPLPELAQTLLICSLMGAILWSQGEERRGQPHRPLTP